MVALTLLMGLLNGTDLDTLIAAHERGQSAIHAVEAEVNRTRERPIATKVILRYFRQGARERETIRSSGGPTEAIGDFSQDSDTVWELLNWDPKTAKALGPDPRMHGKIRGTIDRAIQHGPSGKSSRTLAALLLAVDTPRSGRFTLREATRKALICKVRGRGEVNGRATWVIDLTLPARNATDAGEELEVHLDPAANHLISRIVFRVPRYQSGIETHRSQATWTVREFRDCGNGVWFPVKVDTVGFGGKIAPNGEFVSPPVEHVGPTEVVRLRVNEPVNEADLRVTFPKNLLVVHSPPKGGFHQAELWGEDGPARRFETAAEYQDYLASLPAPSIPFVQQVPGWWIVVVPCLIALLAIILGKQFFRRRQLLKG